MSNYSSFAYVYDKLMDIDYNCWVDYIENLFSHYDKSPNLVVDLACGTGNFTVPLAERGYEMIGVDRSADMLSVAQEKAKRKKLDVLFLNQSLAKLDLYGSADAFLCMIDGVNYMLSPMALYHLFCKIKNCFLEPGGMFIFDISTRYKLSEIIGNNTFIHSGRDIFYAWENIYHADKHISDMYLTFFEKMGKNYRRFEERHLQRAYSEKELVRLLKKAGFSSVDVYDELSFLSPKTDSQRIVFVGM
ncbi:MAG: methyltransferase domain-containing protein [Clostridia bacterium]|nr:methyltransferase domain-containing protein [Clostridia bacterium]